ncbi:MAG: hypothetical protein LBU32_23975 [Clostridiales bacterium]|nr:hypothetical protein [Clostridiales bacterium]
MGDKMIDNINSNPTIDWHAAFFDAIRADFIKYKDSLEISAEVPLTDQPQRIDVLIIKKKKGEVIDKVLAKDFKHLNVIEYKNPLDSFTVRDFYKVLAYAFNLSNLSAPFTGADDITVVVVVTKKPDKFFAYLLGKGIEIESADDGIHIIKVAFPCPSIVKVVESKALDKNEYLWLANLGKKVTVQTFMKLLDERAKLDTSTRAYFEALARANPETVEEVTKMGAPNYEAMLEELGLVHRDVLENEIKARDEKIKRLDEENRKLDEENRKLEKALIKFSASLLADGSVERAKIAEFLLEISPPPETSQ